jgi:probable phosphoglycerate mutase
MQSTQRIFLIRHGETNWSVAGKHTGLTDVPLTEEGKKQAALLGKRLQGHTFQKVFTSPLQRAQETCRLAGMGKHAIIDPNLVEWNYGRYEGLTSEEIRKIDPAWNLFSQGAPKGESVADISARATKVLIKLQSLHGDLALFSSAHFLRILTVKWLQLPPSEGRHFFLSPASLSILGFEHQNPALLLWNELGTRQKITGY